MHWRKMMRSVWARLVLGLGTMLALVRGVNPSFGKFDWVSFFTIILPLVGWLIAEIVVELSEAPQTSSHDKNLYRKFANLFDNNTLNFLKNHDFGNLFHCLKSIPFRNSPKYGMTVAMNLTTRS